MLWIEMSASPRTLPQWPNGSTCHGRWRQKKSTALRSDRLPLQATSLAEACSSTHPAQQAPAAHLHDTGFNFVDQADSQIFSRHLSQEWYWRNCPGTVREHKRDA